MQSHWRLGFQYEFWKDAVQSITPMFVHKSTHSVNTRIGILLQNDKEIIIYQVPSKQPEDALKLNHTLVCSGKYA